MFGFGQKILRRFVKTELTCPEEVFEESKSSIRNFSVCFSVFQWSVFELLTENFGGVPEIEIHVSGGRFEGEYY